MFFVDAVFSKPPTKPIIDFCIGANHACALFDTFQMKCWGSGYPFGATSSYGDSISTTGEGIPYFNPGSSLAIKKAACSNEGICMVLNTGGIKCVGANSFGQAGLGTKTSLIGVPAYVGDDLPVVSVGNGVVVASVVGGAYHNCILASEGKVKCFGANSKGQLGLGDKINRGTLATHMGGNLPFIDFGTGVEIASVHTSSVASYNCVILSKPSASIQRIKCWGYNDYYSLGYGDSLSRGDDAGEMGDYLPLVDFGSESRVKHIELGCDHTCALLVNNELKCIGRGVLGQLASGSQGDITTTGNSIPSVLIDSGKDIKLLSAGDTHICIVYDDMITMKCAGNNSNGQLGQGDQDQRGNFPEAMIPNIPSIDLGTGSIQIKSIHSGLATNCVIFEDDSAKCFGDNSFGQLAIGNTEIIGDEPNEMGSNLKLAQLFSITESPSLSSIKTPTKSPTKSPSSKPKIMTKTSTPSTNSAEKPSNSAATIKFGAILSALIVIAVFSI